jgi:hypothetical protein
MSWHATAWATRGADTRRWAWFNIGCQMCAIDTGWMHGPTQWLEPARPASVQTHESIRLFAPVDVMPGQTGMEL